MGLAGFERARRRVQSAGVEAPAERKPKYVKQPIEDKPYCEECDRHFQNMRAYLMHMKSHTK